MKENCIQPSASRPASTGGDSPRFLPTRTAHSRYPRVLADDRQLQRLRTRTVAEARKFCTAIRPSPVAALTRATGVPSSRASDKHVNVAALLAQLVGHIEQHQRRHAQRNHARRQHQVGVQIRRVQHQNDRVRARRARHLAGQHIDGYSFVLGLRCKAVDAGQVDEGDFFAVGVADVSGVVLDRDAGKIADLLAQLGEPIEKSCLAGVRRTDDGDGSVGTQLPRRVAEPRNGSSSWKRPSASLRMRERR